MKKGTTRVVYLIGGYAFKLPRINRWKSFLRGLLANMDERLWYKNSPQEWRRKMCPSIRCLCFGLVLVCKKALPLNDYAWSRKLISKEDFYPIPVDWKKENFGFYNHTIVIIDYADSRYFCSDCEAILKHSRKLNA